MTDLSPLAEKSRALIALVNQLRSIMSKPEENAARIKKNIDTINALVIPRCFVAIKDGLFHIVQLKSKGDEHDGMLTWRAPRGMTFYADVVWNFDPLNKTWTIIKDRTGEHTPDMHPVYVPE